MNQLPTQLYSTSATRQLDQIAINDFKISGYPLMTRAGEAVFKILQDEFPLAKRILVCCGAGNNAGDGYVVARLAQRAGLEVHVVSMTDVKKLTGEAEQAYKDWKSLGHQLSELKSGFLDRVDVVIDALLGTGLDRDVTGDWYHLIEQINQSSVPVIAVDVPSGLSADTGAVQGIAIKADITLSFIGLNKGLFTHHGPDYAGRILFFDLDVPEVAYKSVTVDAHLLDWDQLKKQFTLRLKNTHKKDYGHVLIVGGDHGMAGAVRLSAEAALRTGAGLVSVVTRPEHVSAINAGCPELMVTGTESGKIPASLLAKADCVVVGPGLGQSRWGMNLLSQVLQRRLPKLLDADALRLLTIEDRLRQDWILTPHPGEAAQMLGLHTAEIQCDRFQAIEKLQQHYGGVVVLKGCGTVIQQQNGVIEICPYGNPGMATAGMGDVLSGVIAGLIGQGFGLEEATRLGVCVHAKAGDQVALKGQRGMRASDLFTEIRSLVNPI